MEMDCERVSIVPTYGFGTFVHGSYCQISVGRQAAPQLPIPGVFQQTGSSKLHGLKRSAINMPEQINFLPHCKSLERSGLIFARASEFGTRDIVLAAIYIINCKMREVEKGQCHKCCDAYSQ